MFALLVFAAITSSTIGYFAISSSNNNNVFAQTIPNHYKAQLTGKDKGPSKDTKASGIAEFVLSNDGNGSSYKINVNNIEKATQAHIHQGKIGENGPIVVTLYIITPPAPKTNGVLVSGNITSADFERPLKGKKQFVYLINLINNGNAYVNVHTEKILKER